MGIYRHKYRFKDRHKDRYKDRHKDRFKDRHKATEKISTNRQMWCNYINADRQTAWPGIANIWV